MRFTVSKGRTIYYEPQDALKEFFWAASWWQEKQSTGEQSLRGLNVYVGLGYTGLVLCGGVLPPAYSRSLLNGWKDGQRVSMNCSKTRSHIIRGHYEIYSLKR